MPITIDDPETEALTRQLAEMTGLSLNDAITVAVEEAIARRRNAESPRQTAARMREQRGIPMSDAARTPLAREAFDEMWRRG